jgi:transaldolase/transaldolase/glucose-6-phosphate isomerase
VASLIGPETINTVTLETLDAFRDHGKADNRLETDMDKAAKILTKLIDNDIDLDAISQNLEAEGIEKFNKAYDKILEVIKKRRIEQMA